MVLRGNAGTGIASPRCAAASSALVARSPKARRRFAAAARECAKASATPCPAPPGIERACCALAAARSRATVRPRTRRRRATPHRCTGPRRGRRGRSAGHRGPIPGATKVGARQAVARLLDRNLRPLGGEADATNSPRRGRTERDPALRNAPCAPGLPRFGGLATEHHLSAKGAEHRALTWCSAPPAMHEDDDAQRDAGRLARILQKCMQP
jgi:hypothetical protein